MKISKLNYTDKETAIADLLAKGVYIENTFEEQTSLSYGIGIQAIVEIGKIVLEQGTYNDEGEVITEPIYADGYAFDVMSEQVIEFESEIFPKTPKHGFAGYNE